MRSSERSNPYRAAAGPELDLTIHTKLMGGQSSDVAPAYSVDAAESAKVVARLKKRYGCKVVIGALKAGSHSHFARLETDPSASVETWGDTEPLAICRLAAVVLAERLAAPARSAPLTARILAR